MSDKKNLPVYGVGPIYVLSCFILTIIGIMLDYKSIIISTEIANKRIIVIIIGLLFIIIGILLWSYAVIFQNIDKEIKKNKLVTTGVYSIVRNPIYSAFIFIFTGILISINNLYLLFLPLIFYISLTVLMKVTEERWLREKFGDEYIRYCKKVNRIIPWFSKSES